MAKESTTEEEIISWVEEGVVNEQFIEKEIGITSIGNYGGYAGDFAFAKVQGITEKGEKKVMNLALKFGKRNSALREAMNFRDVYVRELELYKIVLPIFKQFENSKGVEDKFDAVAKCYKTLLYDDMEVIIMEDLKVAGYELHDSKSTMNDAHIQLILKNYAKFHAFSFALRDQNPKLFEETFRDYSQMTLNFMLSEAIMKICSATRQKVYNEVKKHDPVLAEEFLKVYHKEADTELRDVFYNTPEESVVTHGDCWNNNFMIKYENGRQPVKVAILDWQISTMHSPVMDISYFLYAVSSEEQLLRLDDWLRFYYKNLSKCIESLGSDPNKLFTYEKLIEHWKKYSVYGFTRVSTYLDMMVCDEDDVMSLDNMNKDDVVKELMSPKKTDMAVYGKRLVWVVRCFCRNYQEIASEQIKI